MGTSYATVVYDEACPKCKLPAKAEVQFYPSTGHFRGNMQRVRLGDRLFENSGCRPQEMVRHGLGRAFPLIPLWEGSGLGRIECRNPGCLPSLDESPIFKAVVQITEGVVTGVAPATSIPDSYRLHKGTVNRRKNARREAAISELSTRWRADAIRRLGTDDPKILLAEAMRGPINREMLFAGTWRFHRPQRPALVEAVKARLKALESIRPVLLQAKLLRGRPARLTD